jgi:hypothetical protein
MAIRLSILVLTCLLATEGAARAQEPDPADATAEEIARGVVRNIRRAIAIGPTIGGFSTYGLEGGELGGGLSFGLELEVFKTPVPTPGRLRELVKEKTEAKLKVIIRDRFGGVRPDAETLKRLAREIALEVKAEVVADLRATPPVLQKPRLGILLEANYLFGPADWLVRLGLGIGVGPVSIGPTLSGRFGDETVARLGGELAIHLLPTRSPRSPALDLFLRGDFELHARDTNDDQISLGVRLLLDLI